LGSGVWIQLANLPRHSSSDRHHSGLPAMMPPLQSGKPQASSLRFTESAKGSSSRRSASASAPSASKMMPLSWSVDSVCS
jgi:hypothetical protein